MRARLSPRRKRLRTPNCTHITMERVHCPDDSEYCPLCGRSPPIGFLYECRQDSDIALAEASAAEHQDGPAESPKSPLRRELEEIGLSESVILTAEQGGYTHAQLEKLKALKQELKQTVVDSMHSLRATQVAAQKAQIAYYQKDPGHDPSLCNIPLLAHVPTHSCYYRACHTCRPYFKDRIYLSFEAVFANKRSPLSLYDLDVLPTRSAQIMRGIGLRQPSGACPPSSPASADSFPDSTSSRSRSSVLTFKTTQSDVDDIDASRRHRRRFYKMGHRSSGSISRDLSRLPMFTRLGLKTAFQGIFRPSRESSSSGSNITLPLARTSVARSLDDVPAVGEFDMGALRRVKRQKERNDARNGACSGSMDDLSGPSKQTGHLSTDFDGEGESSSGSDFTVYSCGSEGSEVEVEGGVALTEEAVETQTPDIINNSRAAQQAGVVQLGVDVGSIMAQV